MKSILFLDMHREGRSPSQRFRYEQYLPLLRAHGFRVHHSFLLNEKDDKIFYSRGNYVGKGLILLKSIFRRTRDLIRSRAYDFVFIQREAFMLGTVFFERLLVTSGAKLIFDFDDAIWLHQVSSTSPNQNLNFLKKPSKTSTLIALAHTVVAGNSYLGNYAIQFNKNVRIIPTTIDTELYTPIKNPTSSIINIGWSGSKTTVDHFKEVIPALVKIKQKYGDKITFTLLGDSSYLHKTLGIEGKTWNLDQEVSDLRTFDIGIMPLPADEWSKGKCGCKALQYMGLSIATVASPVGINQTIIQDGVNGFLCHSEEEWVDKLSILIVNEELRLTIGARGRETVLKNYSMISNTSTFLSLFS